MIKSKCICKDSSKIIYEDEKVCVISKSEESDFIKRFKDLEKRCRQLSEGVFRHIVTEHFSLDVCFAWINGESCTVTHIENIKSADPLLNELISKFNSMFFEEDFDPVCFPLLYVNHIEPAQQLINKEIDKIMNEERELSLDYPEEDTSRIYQS